MQSLRRRESCRNSLRRFAGIDCVDTLFSVQESLVGIAECAFQKCQSEKERYAKNISKALEQFGSKYSFYLLLSWA